MLVIIESRQIVADAYSASFGKLGFSLQWFTCSDFVQWFKMESQNDLDSIDAYLIGDANIGDANFTSTLIPMIKSRVNRPVIALVDAIRVDTLVEYYKVGVDDVIRKPIHIREVICRINAISRRSTVEQEYEVNCDLHVFVDGRNPIVGGHELELPRRERRLLEFLVSRAGRRVTKEQIFNSIYGIFEEEVNECVVESHVSKLRKKLRERLGYDPIDSKRYLGYCLQLPEPSIDQHQRDGAIQLAH